MKKAIEILKAIIDKKVVALLVALVAMTVPVTASWIGLNGATLIGIVTALLIFLSTVIGILADKPFQKVDEENKGGTE